MIAACQASDLIAHKNGLTPGIEKSRYISLTHSPAIQIDSFTSPVLLHYKSLMLLDSLSVDHMELRLYLLPSELCLFHPPDP